MAKRPEADPLASDLAPDVPDSPPPGAGEPDRVPRMYADDGQPNPAAPINVVDDPELRSSLAPDPEEAPADTTPVAGQPADTTITPAAGQPGIDHMTPEQLRRYALAGMQAEAMRNMPLPPAFDDLDEPATPVRGVTPNVMGDRGPINRQPVDQPAEDPDLDRLADHIRRRAGLDRLDEVSEYVRNAKAREAQSRQVERERRIGTYTGEFLDSFVKTNELARSDEDVAEAVRERVIARVNERLNLERAGAKLPPITNWGQALAIEAANAAEAAYNRFTNRERRKTTAVQQVANRTVSTAGGVAPRPGQPLKPKTEAERSAEMVRNAASLGWQS